MRILLYNPDNGVTRNFMPHLWMFLLQSLTPPGHEVLLIDGNAQPMDEEGIARYVREHNIGLVGIGAMTRMIAKAYRMADAIRAVGVPVVMGGPHVTEEAEEALGRSGDRATRTPWPSVKPMKPGRRSLRMPCAANSRISTLPWMSLVKSVNPLSSHIPRSRGIRSTWISSIWFQRSRKACSSVSGPVGGHSALFRSNPGAGVLTGASSAR